MCCIQLWTKLSGESEDPSQPTPSLLQHPSARDGHSACTIERAPRPLLLITGGWDASDHALSDLWLLDINSGLWKQVKPVTIKIPSVLSEIYIRYLEGKIWVADSGIPR